MELRFNDLEYHGLCYLEHKQQFDRFISRLRQCETDGQVKSLFVGEVEDDQLLCRFVGINLAFRLEYHILGDRQKQALITAYQIDEISDPKYRRMRSVEIDDCGNLRPRPSTDPYWPWSLHNGFPRTVAWLLSDLATEGD